ncbi:MAG: PEP-utilizing enzyme [bacterium]|nr:PEP-utilizing enzyme [bacterium]
MSESPLEFSGMIASEGKALGRARVLETIAGSVPHRSLMPQEVGPELSRFRDAVQASRTQMKELIGAGRLGHELSAIFEAQLLLLEDPMLIDETREKIRSRKMNAEWALAEEVGILKDFLSKARNTIFQERAADLEDMSNRILSNLMGVPEGDIRIPGLKDLPPDSIVVAHDLSPSLMLHIRGNCVGIVTEAGGVTGHMAILAKSRGIPALVHVANLTQKIKEGDALLIDALPKVTGAGVAPAPMRVDSGQASSGRLVCRPGEADVEAYHVYISGLRRRSEAGVRSPISLPDGSEARLWLNLDQLPESDPAAGASGVGLFRTEFLYLKDPTLLNDPERQAQCYADLFSGPLAGRPITLRLLDAGDDKAYPPQAAVRDRDLRGVRFLLANPNILESQLRAILVGVSRAGAADGQCRLMVPVVSRFEEMEAVRETLARVRDEVEAELGSRLPETALGMMLETPAAALMCEVFASNAAFFSIGTNDLTRLAIGVDRDNTLPYDELFYQPALFRMIAMILERATVPLSICGEIAGRPDLLPILIGLGVREFSVAPSAVLNCFESIVALDEHAFERGGEQARRVCQAHTAADVRALL